MNNQRTRDLILIALFPALMAATAGISIPLGAIPAITLQTFFVMMAGLLLGAKKAAYSMIIYVILGSIGIPVFAGYTGGLGIILGKSGGFLFGFIIAAFFIGFMKNIKIINKNLIAIPFILVTASVIIYMCGATYIALLTNTSIFSILATFTPYYIGDFIKIGATYTVYLSVRSYVTYEYA